MGTLFPADIRAREWAEFCAAGFDRPVTGLIHRDSLNPAVCGVPLGGIDTGCLDLETSGLFGYSSIFNSLTPRGGPMNAPVLGLAVRGRTWLLARPRTKRSTHDCRITDHADDLEQSPPLNIEGVSWARDVTYWGHYPVADLEFDLGDCPLSAGVRAWSPFVPGDVEASMVPGAVFEVHVRNGGGRDERGTLAMSFPGPDAEEAGVVPAFRRALSGEGLRGVVSGTNQSHMALAALDQPTARSGAGLGGDGERWSRIADALPAVTHDAASIADHGASVAVDFQVPAGGEIVIRFVLAWHSPRWRAGGRMRVITSQWITHMYATRFADAAAAAGHLAHHHAGLLQRVLAWQSAVYDAHEIPPWLRHALVNILHLITETGVWGAKAPPLPPWVREEDGLFGLNESPRVCPQIECIPCSWYGNLPLVYFFPRLALSTLRGYLHYQYEEGAPPWVFGGGTVGSAAYELTMPSRGYQITQNMACYLDLVHRYWLCHGHKDFLHEFYPSIKKATLYTLDLNRGPDGILGFPDRPVSLSGMPWETETFEWCKWSGLATHIGGVHLAQLRMAQRMAELAGDREFASQCGDQLERGFKGLEEKLWADGYYLNMLDPQTGRRHDDIFAYQLDGQWMTDFHGLPGVFREDRVRTTLQTIREKVAPLSPFGVVNFARPDGTTPVADPEFFQNGYAPYDLFPPEEMMLGMTCMYHDQVAFGLDLCRRCWEHIELNLGMTWDAPNLINGQTGAYKFGNDYYQNMILWSLPAALAGADLSGPCKPGGLVDRVIKAGAA